MHSLFKFAHMKNDLVMLQDWLQEWFNTADHSRVLPYAWMGFPGPNKGLGWVDQNILILYLSDAVSCTAPLTESEQQTQTHVTHDHQARSPLYTSTKRFQSMLIDAMVDLRCPAVCGRPWFILVHIFPGKLSETVVWAARVSVVGGRGELRETGVGILWVPR